MRILREAIACPCVRILDLRGMLKRVRLHRPLRRGLPHRERTNLPRSASSVPHPRQANRAIEGIGATRRQPFKQPVERLSFPLLFGFRPCLLSLLPPGAP